MSQLIGTVFTALVIDENEHYYFVQQEGDTFRLRKSETPLKLGEAVEGFGYYNQKQQLAFTTQLPKIAVGKFAFCDVVDSRRDLGVFLDVGLPDKDIPLSLDELPEMKTLWPKKGDRLMVGLRVDDKHRLWATLAEDVQIVATSMPADIKKMHNQNITATVYRLKLAGTYVITSESHLGFIHPSERYQEPRLGEVVQGRVIGMSPDGVLNISLKPRAHEVISDDAAMLLTLLEQSRDGRLPFTDKSAPEDIKQAFGISKGQFKRALGSLLKQRLVKQEDGFTVLLKPNKSSN